VQRNSTMGNPDRWNGVSDVVKRAA
jgi:hypothetical protein